MKAADEVDALMRRWRQLSLDPDIPEETRRVLRVCLEDLRAVFGLTPPEQMPHEHPSGEHDE